MQHGKDTQSTRFPITNVLRMRPNAVAEIRGGEDHLEISGFVKLYQTVMGVIVYAEVGGLPYDNGECVGRVFGFHIHEGFSCSGTPNDSFADTKTHYSPNGCEHPYHEGDMPPLFGNRGFALCLFLTDRFSVKDVVGRTVVIHDAPDDFTSQPAGNSGTKIACGVIKNAL